jgi:hypothetical protein
MDLDNKVATVSLTPWGPGVGSCSSAADYLCDLPQTAQLTRNLVLTKAFRQSAINDCTSLFKLTRAMTILTVTRTLKLTAKQNSSNFRWFGKATSTDVYSIEFKNCNSQKYTQLLYICRLWYWKCKDSLELEGSHSPADSVTATTALAAATGQGRNTMIVWSHWALARRPWHWQGPGSGWHQ